MIKEFDEESSWCSVWSCSSVDTVELHNCAADRSDCSCIFNDTASFGFYGWESSQKILEVFVYNFMS